MKCQNREDVKTMCDWVITLPKQDFSLEPERKFFKSAYEFMKQRYGDDNVISTWVHKDEAGQPHMHFAFIPVVLDKKKGIYKVSAKEAITKKGLQCIHKQIEEYISKELDMNVFMLNGATKDGNKSIEELKETEDRRRENEALKNEQSMLKKDIEKEKEKLLEVKSEHEKLLSYYAYEADLPPAKKKRSLTGREIIEIEVEDWEKHSREYQELLGTATYAKEKIERLAPFEEGYREMKQYACTLKEKAEILEYDCQKLKEETLRMKQRFNDIMSQMKELFPNVTEFIEQFRTKKKEKAVDEFER